MTKRSIIEPEGGERMAKKEYVVKGTNDSRLENDLNAWTEEGLELVTLYPRGSSAVFVVFTQKTKE